MSRYVVRRVAFNTGVGAKVIDRNQALPRVYGGVDAYARATRECQRLCEIDRRVALVFARWAP